MFLTAFLDMRAGPYDKTELFTLRSPNYITSNILRMIGEWRGSDWRGVSGAVIISPVHKYLGDGG